MSKSLNFKGPNRTHAQILTLCVCGLDQRKMAFSHGLEEVPLYQGRTQRLKKGGGGGGAGHRYRVGLVRPCGARSAPNFFRNFVCETRPQNCPTELQILEFYVCRT